MVRIWKSQSRYFKVSEMYDDRLAILKDVCAETKD